MEMPKFDARAPRGTTLELANYLTWFKHKGELDPELEALVKIAIKDTPPLRVADRLYNEFMADPDSEVRGSGSRFWFIWAFNSLDSDGTEFR